MDGEEMEDPPVETPADGDPVATDGQAEPTPGEEQELA